MANLVYWTSGERNVFPLFTKLLNADRPAGFVWGRAKRYGEMDMTQKRIRDSGFSTWGIQTGPFAACGADFVPKFFHFSDLYTGAPFSYYPRERKRARSRGWKWGIIALSTLIFPHPRRQELPSSSRYPKSEKANYETAFSDARNCFLYLISEGRGFLRSMDHLGPVVKKDLFRYGPKNSPFLENSPFHVSKNGLFSRNGLFFGPYRNGSFFTTGPWLRSERSFSDR